MRYEKKSAIVAMVLLFACLLTINAFADAVNVLPEVAQGQVDICVMGKNVRPEVSGIPALDVDVHQIIFGNQPFNSYNGINLVELKLTDPSLNNLIHVFSQNYSMEVIINPAAINNAFVVLAEKNVDNSYKIILDANANKISVYQIQGGRIVRTAELSRIIRPMIAYQISMNFGYESSGGQGGNRITIKEMVTGQSGEKTGWSTIFDKKLYEIGLAAPSNNSGVFHFFVGTNRSSAIFRNDLSLIHI